MASSKAATERKRTFRHKKNDHQTTESKVIRHDRFMTNRKITRTRNSMATNKKKVDFNDKKTTSSDNGWQVASSKLFGLARIINRLLQSFYLSRPQGEAFISRRTDKAKIKKKDILKEMGKKKEKKMTRNFWTQKPLAKASRLLLTDRHNSSRGFVSLGSSSSSVSSTQPAIDPFASCYQTHI